MSVLASLEKHFDGRTLLVGDNIPVRNQGDWSSEPCSRPLAVVRPSTTSELARAVRLCAELDVPMVAQGGMTGLCGGATPRADWVAISMERFVGIEDIDTTNATMTVKAGTPLEVIQNAADDVGLMFPLDLGARGSCTIGGNIATNAGGTRVIRYGMARDLVLGVEVVLPDGTVLNSLNKLIKNNAGFDLKHLFIGSEGTLGIVTRAVLKLFPRPRSSLAALCGLSSFANVEQLLRSARTTIGTELSAFELMWEDFWTVVTSRPGVRAPLDNIHTHYVLVEMQGLDEERDSERFHAWLADAIEHDIVTDAAVAQTIGQYESFWALRDSGAEFAATIGPHISYDVGVTIDRMEAFVARCKAALSEEVPGCKSVLYGHVGDGNLHLDAWMPREPVSKAFKASVDAVVYGVVREFGGSISAEHGIGSAKASWLDHSRTKGEIEVMKLIKKALDPNALMNPGKVIEAVPNPIRVGCEWYHTDSRRSDRV